MSLPVHAETADGSAPKVAGKLAIGLVQINNSFSGQNYLPYSIALLQTYVQKFSPQPDRYEFLTPLFSLGATRVEILRKVGIPRAMLYLFASLTVAITLAFIGSLISEAVGGNRGIGFLILSAGARNDAPTTFAGLFAVALMGVAMYAGCAPVETRMTRWAFRSPIVS
jgi:hypothetical protein